MVMGTGTFICKKKIKIKKTRNKITCGKHRTGDGILFLESIDDHTNNCYLVLKRYGFLPLCRSPPDWLNTGSLNSGRKHHRIFYALYFQTIEWTKLTKSLEISQWCSQCHLVDEPWSVLLWSSQLTRLVAPLATAATLRWLLCTVSCSSGAL